VRILVRLVSAVLGLAVAGVGVILGLEGAWAHWNPGHGGLVVPWRQWRAAAGGLAWSDVPVQVTAGLVALAGLLLILTAAAARQRDVRMYDPAPEVSVVTSSRSLARMLRHRVRAQDAVSEAAVRASPRRVKVYADTRFRSADELRPLLAEAADDALGALPVPRTPRVSIAVRSRLVTSVPAGGGMPGEATNEARNDAPNEAHEKTHEAAAGDVE
jgi:hypothetical protein